MAAAGALAGGMAWLSFALGYAWAATRVNWILCLLAGLSAYLVVGMATIISAPPFILVVILVIGSVLLAPFLFPRLTQSTGLIRSSSAELIARMIAGGAVTVAVTHLSPVLGPKFSGLFAVFPVMGIVLAAFSHRTSGNIFTIRLLRSMVSGFHAFIVFCLTVTLALPVIGVAAGFVLALGLSLTVHLGVLWFTRRSVDKAPVHP